ncbi:transmembrane protein 171 [Rhinophrynus dorsalis]
MQPTFFSFSLGLDSPAQASRLIFFLFVFGVMTFCAGFLLSIFGFQSCQYNDLSKCSVTFKVIGPSIAVIGLASILLARSRARLEFRRRQMVGDQTDPDNFFLCGESRQFIQFVIFGFLFVTSGILISVLGVWIPGCNGGSRPINGTVTEYRNCGFLSLQIMGPLIVLIGLCFFAVAHIKKRHHFNEGNESSVDEPPTPTDEPFHITVGDAVIIFPPPPPPYFADPFPTGVSNVSGSLARSERPPSYNSIFNIRARHTGQRSDRETIYTISLQSSSEGHTNPHFLSEPPPKYEEKDSSEPELGQGSSTVSTEATSSHSPPDPEHL